MTAVPGRCLCGDVRFHVTSEPRFVAHCHCDQCRRAHSAAFVTWAGFQRDELSLEDGCILARFETVTGATRSFCPKCGSTLFYESPRWEGEIHVALGNLTGAVNKAPGAHVYADKAPAWCPITDDLPRYGGESGTEPL